MHRSQTAPDLLEATRKASAGTSSTIKANYGPLRNRLLKLTPSNYHCRLFCGGARCKYCNPDNMQKDQQAIEGLYSTWVTDEILAMSRPTTSGIEKFRIIERFHKHGVQSVINLQRVFEHQECGPPLDKSGFSYDSEEFMKNQIFHYNFGWPDFGCASLSALLDMVKVLNFALSQGKVAIHCHAGLGRTGVLVCCFLIWSRDFSDKDAVEYVRLKRPCSVQTAEQVKLVEQFSYLWKSLKPVFRPDLTFDDYLQQQQMTLHGSEARVLKFIPKIVFVIGEKLLELYGVNALGTLETKLNDMASGQNIKFKKLISRKTLPLIEQDHPIVANSETTDKPATLLMSRRKANSLSLASGFPMPVGRGAKLPPLVAVNNNHSGAQVDGSRSRPSSSSGKLQQKHDNGDKRDRHFNDSSKLSTILNNVRNADLKSVKSAQYFKEMLNTGNFLSRWDELLIEEDALIFLLLLNDWFHSLKFSVILDESIVKQKVDRKLLKNTKWTVWYISRIFRLLCHDKNSIKEAAKFMSEIFCWNCNNEIVNNFMQSCIENFENLIGDKEK